MVYNLNGKSIKIPDKEIKKNMEILDLSEKEAIQLYLEDEGYLENEEVAELTKKAKDSGIMSTIHGAKSDKPKAKIERERKENPTKASIIAELVHFLQEESENACENVEILNKERQLSFRIGENAYELTLVQKRKPKN